MIAKPNLIVENLSARKHDIMRIMLLGCTFWVGFPPRDSPKTIVNCSGKLHRFLDPVISSPNHKVKPRESSEQNDDGGGWCCITCKCIRDDAE